MFTCPSDWRPDSEPIIRAMRNPKMLFVAEPGMHVGRATTAASAGASRLPRGNGDAKLPRAAGNKRADTVASAARKLGANRVGI